MAPDKSTFPRSMSLQMQGSSSDQTGSSNGNGVNGVSSASLGRNQANNIDDLKPVKELSDMLATGLTEEQLALCIQLIQDGIPPRTLADFVKRSREFR